MGEGRNFQGKEGAEKECWICQDTWDCWRTKPRSHFLWPYIHCLSDLYRKVSCAQGPYWLQERNSSTEKDTEYLGEKENGRGGGKDRGTRRGQDNPRQEGILFCNLREPREFAKGDLKVSWQRWRRLLPSSLYFHSHTED